MLNRKEGIYVYIGSAKLRSIQEIINFLSDEFNFLFISICHEDPKKQYRLNNFTHRNTTIEDIEETIVQNLFNINSIIIEMDSSIILSKSEECLKKFKNCLFSYLDKYPINLIFNINGDKEYKKLDSAFLELLNRIDGFYFIRNNEIEDMNYTIISPESFKKSYIRDKKIDLIFKNGK